MSHFGFMSRPDVGCVRDRQPRRGVRTAGATTTVAAGALATVLTASGSAATWDPPATTAATFAVALTSGPSNPFHTEIDALLAAQGQVADTNSDYPFIVSSDLPLLPAYTQNMALTMLATQLSQLSHSQFHTGGALTWIPYPWSAPAAEPRAFLALPNPDNQYSLVQVGQDQTYTITVTPHPGSQDVSFVPEAGNGVTSDYTNLPGAIDLAHSTPNPDGSYTITLSSTEQTGNWVDTSGASRVLIRDTVGDWGQLHDSFAIQQEGATEKASLPLFTDAQISSMLSTVAANMPAENASSSYFGQQQPLDTLANNTFTPIVERTGVGGSNLGGPALAGQIGSVGHFALQPDQALIVQVPNVDAAYSGVQLANDWGQTAPYATVQGSLNDTQIFQDPDGFTYYVVSDQDPGVANWLDDSGLATGNILLRWQNFTGSVPTTPIQAEVVNVADVKSEIGDLLPADTPLVTAAERAADLQQRLFEYDYVHDQNHGTAWLGANLELDQVKAAIGADEFTAIFGGQVDVPSVADRLSPALSPNLTTVAHDIATNPAGSLSAIGDNLSLAAKDIGLPLILAVLRLYQISEHTVAAVGSAISSGDLSQALTALGAGVQGLGTVVDETFTDPATSITAGILNARDDLAVAIMNAPGAADGTALLDLFS